MAKTDPKHEAKRKVLSDLSDAMKSRMGDKVKSDMESLKKPMKEITIAAPDKEGLAKGLDLAKKLTPKMEELSEGASPELDEEETEESPEEESSETLSQEESDVIDQLEDESSIDEMIKKLEEKKRSLQK